MHVTAHLDARVEAVDERSERRARGTEAVAGGHRPAAVEDDLDGRGRACRSGRLDGREQLEHDRDPVGLLHRDEVDELLFQQAQDAKRRAADAIARGDERAALTLLADAGARLAGVDEDERRAVLGLASDIGAGRASRAAKRSRMEHHAKSRRRGRGM